MERGSDKHSPRIDDQLKHETDSIVRGAPAEARTDEAREQEGPGEDEPTPDARLSGSRGQGPPAGLSADDAEARSDLARHLQGSVFPAEREELMRSAAEMNAPQRILGWLRDLPPGEVYENVHAVWRALGGEPEQGDHRPAR